jgi:futalosine hydrolase
MKLHPDHCVKSTKNTNSLSPLIFALMNILLLAATTSEIGPFLDQYRQDSEAFVSGHTLDVLITGIGLPAATYALTKQIHIRRPDLVIQAGIAGCFDTRIPLADVVAVRQDLIADMGVHEKQEWKTLFDLRLVSLNQFPFSKGMLVNKSDALKKIKLKKVNAVSVNEITTAVKKKKLYSGRFTAKVESMEGAALHYVCLRENIAFLQLRAISNYIGERNKKNWKITESITNLNKELIRLLQQL